jgi:hypothetical protein
VKHDYLTKRNCHDCKAKPGEMHKGNCDVERCPLCGHQAMSCGCVYEVNEMSRERLKQEHPDIYKGGPTEAMYKKLEEAFAEVGGPLPWTGIWPGVAECVEFGWYSKRAKVGYRSCDKNDPDAGPDLNRLGQEAIWSVEKRRWVLPT